MASVSLRHIYKVYRAQNNKKRGNKNDAGRRSGDYLAVNNFNMEIEDGEFIVFVGPSGCGKSTTLRMIAGLEEITAGDLYIDGRLVNDVEPKDRDIAMVFQNYALYPHMTAGENIAFGLRMHKTAYAKKDKNGNTIVAINNKKIREIQNGLKTVDIDLRYAEENDAELVFKHKLISLKGRYDELIEKKNSELASKIGDEAISIKNKYAPLEEEIIKQAKAVIDALNATLKVIRLRYAGKPQEEIETAKNISEQLSSSAGIDLSEITQGDIFLALKERKTKLENDLKYYKETPLPVYRYKHLTKEYIDGKVKWAAEILGVTELLDTKPKAMSGGQRQRIALGRAIVREPKLMLLDEPLSNLDAKLRSTMRSEIVKLHDELKTTFIYVTHDQIEAMTMGTRIVVMKFGVIQQIDTPTNLYDYPVNKFVAGFIGTPQMNFFDVIVKKQGDKLNVTFANGQEQQYNLANMRIIEEEYLDGSEHELILGIRGENITLDKNGLKTKLVIKEILGNTIQMFVKLTADSPDCVVCSNERNNYKAGDEISVVFDEKRIHFFNKETECAVMKRAFGNE